MRTLKPEDENLGCWCAFTEDGRTQDERRLRLNSAPKQLQSDIKRHCQLVFKMRQK